MTTPLELATQAISAIYGCEVAATDKFAIEIVFPHNSDNCPPFELGVEWKPKADALHIAMGVQYDVSPLKKPEEVARLLKKSVEPFLEGICDAVVPDHFGLCLESDGACIPYYDVMFEYAPMQEEEIVSMCRGLIVRGSRMLMLLSSTFYCMERGYVPTIEERMKLLQVQFGKWELESLSSDVPERGTRLPKRLFGGIGTLMVQ